MSFSGDDPGPRITIDAVTSLHYAEIAMPPKALLWPWRYFPCVLEGTSHYGRSYAFCGEFSDSVGFGLDPAEARCPRVDHARPSVPRTS